METPSFSDGLVSESNGRLLTLAVVAGIVWLAIGSGDCRGQSTDPQPGFDVPDPGAEFPPDRTPPVFVESTSYFNPDAMDQDDLCIWRNSRKPSASLIVSADKDANRIFVYRVDGTLHQSIPLAKPGNIDLRYGFMLGGRRRPLIVVCGRDEQQLIAFTVDEDRHLRRVDDGSIRTHANYGGGILHRVSEDAFYFFATSKTDGVQQWKLADNGSGRVSGELVRAWPFSICEGLVGDDRTGNVYVSVETEGIFRLPGNPEDSTPPLKVASVGVDGFIGDAEGIALLRWESKTFLVVSDQQPSRFRVYRQPAGGSEYPFLGSFALERALNTDSFDLSSQSLGGRFPAGMFVCHSDFDDGRRLRVTDMRQILTWLSEVDSPK